MPKNKLDPRQLERLRYIAAAKVAFHKENWQQVIFICEHLIRIEKSGTTGKQEFGKD